MRWPNSKKRALKKVKLLKKSPLNTQIKALKRDIKQIKFAQKSRFVGHFLRTSFPLEHFLKYFLKYLSWVLKFWSWLHLQLFPAHCSFQPSTVIAFVLFLAALWVVGATGKATKCPHLYFFYASFGCICAKLYLYLCLSLYLYFNFCCIVSC